jgi:methionyl-tRNA formyltransferase
MSTVKSYVIASQRKWNADLARRLAVRTGQEFIAIGVGDDLTEEKISIFKPRYVFVTHWSTRIPDEVWSTHECIIFHMTDVPYGRGGSPLQNLIAAGHATTVVSALRCVREMDAGAVYMKKPLSLAGSAEEIFMRADAVIEAMIAEIVASEPVPAPQSGEPVVFKRRRPEDGDLSKAQNMEQCYDLIRMLDAEGYPHAYLDVGALRIEFRRVTKRVDGLVADVTIRERRKADDP